MSSFKHKQSYHAAPGRFKSEAQKQKMYQLVAEGKLKQEVLDRWEQNTPKDQALPSKINNPPKVKLEHPKPRKIRR